MKNTTQGFTLIELLIVIAIIGILAAVLIPNLLGARKRAYDTSAQACAKSIQTAEATYQIDKQAYLTITKANTAADNIAITTPDTAGNVVSPVNNQAALDLGLSSNCANKEITIGGSATSSTAYSITVADSRGSKTYTVTPNSLIGN